MVDSVFVACSNHLNNKFECLIISLDLLISVDKTSLKTPETYQSSCRWI